MTARYDGHADWYEATAAASATASREAILDLVPPGPGACLDLGCGTGLYADVLRERGWDVVGVDVSADQIRIAMGREPVVLGDGVRLPFADERFGLVAAFWVHGDVDDLGALLAETRRVLEPDGSLVLYGVHPCFNGPCVEARDDGGRIVHPTYRRSGWHESSPWWSADGIRHRVGVRHRTLAELFTDVLASGLELTGVVEPRDDPVPYILAITARRRSGDR